MYYSFLNKRNTMGGELNKGPETLNARGNRGLNGAAPPSGGGKVK